MPNGPQGEQQHGTLEESPDLFINRELSWIEFNRHVLEEAADTSHPLLERVKFLAIFSNNLDEFFMIRVSGLQRQVEKGVRELPPDGMSPSLQLEAVRETLAPLLEQQSALWEDDLVPSLRKAGIGVRSHHDLDPAAQESTRDYFIREIFPVLTPLAFDKSHPFPFISNLSLNLAAVVRDRETGEEHFARVKVPTSLFPRLMKVPRADERAGREERIFLEDLISENLDLLFPGLEVVASYPFRVTRDADLEIEEDEASDLLTAVEESVELRRVGSPVRVEVTPEMPGTICAMMAKMLGVAQSMFYRQNAPLGMADLMTLLSTDRPDLKDVPFTPSVPAPLEHEDRIFSGVRGKDLLLFHPYESFSPVIALLRQAARDRDVLAIKITLYRVGPNSPVVDALLEARENGKAVAALIELKARFDEENNIGWARALERAGVHVVYGLVGLKVHAKVCMVVRREKQGIVRYMHMGTGNYNASSARVYTDMGLFTTDPVIAADVADLFNSLTGCARIGKYRKLLVAPLTIRSEIIARIEREILRHRSSGDGCLIFKMNALVDRECIMALYRASCAGVRVVLQVRGICCLRPGIPGVSENITVTTIVGRFLEHARVYYFRNGGDEEVFLGSADLMPRNLDRRVEILFPVEDPRIRRAIADMLIPVHLRDNVKARRLLPGGTYERVKATPGKPACNAQEWCIGHRGAWQDDRGD